MSSPTDYASTHVTLLEGTAQVLDAVRVHGCRTRVEIMERTGLTRMVVSQRVHQLIEVGLLSEEGLGPSSGGRPPRRLRFDPPGYLLVADVGFTSIDVAITNLRGELIAHEAQNADVTAGPDTILSSVEASLDRLRSDRPDLGPLWGVGIGIPAPVEFSTGRAVSPPISHGWDGYPVRERLADFFGVPVWVDKDVNIMMLGEWREGAAQGERDAVFIKCGTGVGLSMISEGHLHRGAQGGAGDLGQLLHLASLDQARPGRTSLPHAGPSSFWLAESIVQKAHELAKTGASPHLARALAHNEQLTPQVIAEAAADGDGPSLELLRLGGALVGTALATIASLFNPSLMIVGGGMSQAGDFFMAAIRELVYARAIPLATRDLRIVNAELGSKAGVVGAAAMVLDQLFSDSGIETTVARFGRDLSGPQAARHVAR